MDEIYETLCDLFVDWQWDYGESTLDTVKEVMHGNDTEWLDAAYVMVCKWDDQGRGDGDPTISFTPINGDLDGLIDAMQSSLDHADGDYGFYGITLYNLETGETFKPVITSVELVEVGY